MSPQKSLSEIKLEDIDFESIKDCTDKAVIKRYLKLLEDDGNYFIELINACKDRLLEVSPKEYYLLYPRATTAQEEEDAFRDILEWEANVKETDAALRRSKKDAIFDDLPAKAEWQAKSVDDQVRKVKVAEPRRVRDGEEEAIFEEEAATEVVTNVTEVPEAHKKHMADSEKEKGNEAFYSKDFSEAEAYYSRSLQYQADDASAWANRALVRLKLSNFQGALEDCEHALALNGTHVKALHRKGKALYELQRFADAVKIFQQALSLSPGNSQINGDLMVARRRLRDDAPPEESTCRIEELADDAPTAAVASAPLRPGYTRVQIEEDSDSEDEAADAKKASVQSNGKPAPGNGFVKVAIEEVSGSEDEGPEDGGAAKLPAATAGAGPFQPPPRASAGDRKSVV